MPLGVELILPSASNRVQEVVSNLLKIDDTVAFAHELGALSFESETEEVSSLAESYTCGRGSDYNVQTPFIIQLANVHPPPLFYDPQLG